MNIPSLPIDARPQKIVLNEDLINKFRKALRSEGHSVPPTVGAVALQGAFEILNQSVQVDWKKLLHVSQTFEYLAPLKVPMNLRAQTRLQEIRTRAQMHFLTFETQLVDEAHETAIMNSKSTLIVRAS